MWLGRFQSENAASGNKRNNGDGVHSGKLGNGAHSGKWVLE